MRNLRFIEQLAVTDPVSLLNVEHRSGDGSAISQLDAVMGRMSQKGGKWAYRGRLARDRSSRQSRHPNASAKSALLANSWSVVKRHVLMTARLIVSPQNLKHRSDHKFSGPRRERAVDHLGVKTAQILADERLGDYLVAVWPGSSGRARSKYPSASFTLAGPHDW